jgi:peroxiredoxin
MLTNMAFQAVQSSATGRTLRWGVLLVFAGAVLLACASSDGRAQGYLEGRITVESSVDASGDYSDFRVLVVDARGRAVDTLGHATTNRDGRFQMTVSAPERGIYTLMVWGRRGQQRLASTDYVVAQGDTATLQATFPLGNRRLRVRSQEHAALNGYRNTLAQHRRSLTKQLQADAEDSNAMARRIRQTSSVLWRLQDTFPGTYASQLAATESLSLLAGWNDSLVVERARTLSPSNPQYVEVAQIARRAAARLNGQDAALNLLDAFESRAQTDEQRAGIQAARVRTFIDSLQSEAALAAAEDLRTNYPNTEWAEWADRATYEVKNLLPGKTAPNVRARTLDGDSLSLRRLRGRPVVLEYFRPGDDLYGRQLATRQALYEATRPDSVAFVSVSVSPDTLLFEALLDTRSLPGHRIIAPEGEEDPVVTAYNVAEGPTRFLIDAEGRIVGRYDGTAFLALQEDLTQLVEDDASDSN